MYIVCMPEAIHNEGCKVNHENPGDEDATEKENDEAAPLSTHCTDCGSLTLYAGDSTYSYSSTDQNTLSAMLTHKYTILSNYNTSNKLKVNQDKMHTIVMTTDSYRRCNDVSVNMMAGNEIIEASEVERLLGVYLHQGMKFTEHLTNNKHLLLNSLGQRIGALK